MRMHRHFMSVKMVMCTRHAGWTRQELLEMTGLSDDGVFSKMLKVLVVSQTD